MLTKVWHSPLIAAHLERADREIPVNYVIHSSKGLTSASIILTVALVCRGTSAQEGFEGWHLEPGVGQAHLVMVARVARISRVTVVEGAKTDVGLREYRFQPVRLLKGIFQRDQLSMTASDLGCTADDGPAAPPLWKVSSAY